MMPAAKHGDPQLGVDIHLCTTPAGPVPLPTPHMSVVFDPFDYIPIIGATITVCGMKRATAGTGAQVVHIPPGFPFAPKLPDSDDELFMGSATVVADGDPFSHIAHPVLSCQIAGMPSPFRPKKKAPLKPMLLPTVFNLAIPTTVFIGGPPTISMMGLAFKAGFAGLGKLAKSKFAKALGERFKSWKKAKFGQLPSGFLKCKILRAEPVNIVTGAVAVEQSDFELTGRLPLSWLRSYASDNPRRGVCGYGWETPADARLEYDAQTGLVQFIWPGDAPAIFGQWPLAPGEAATELELWNGARLSDHGAFWQVQTKDDRRYRFDKAALTLRADGVQEVLLAELTDLCGNSLRFERHGAQLLRISESAGRQLEFIGHDGLIDSVTLLDPARGERRLLVNYRYDEHADLSAVLDALGNPYRFAYDAHRMLRHTDRNGLSFYYAFADGPDGPRVVHAWGDGGLYNYRFDYEDTLRERRITDSLGHVSLVKLSQQGLPLNELDPLGGLTVFAYDEVGRTRAVTDPGGRTTEYQYDERGNLLKLVRADGTVLQQRFDADNKPIAISAPNGASWQQQWDARGLLLAQKSPLGAVSHYQYDQYGQLTAVSNPRQAITHLQYDTFGHVNAVTDALGQTTRLQHDLLGNVLIRQTPDGQQTQYAYDAKNRLRAVKRASGATLRCDYDAEDNLTRFIDELGAQTQLEYFGQGMLARRRLPDGHVLEYLHDTEEQLIGVRNQRGELYQLRRDPLGRIIEEQDYWGQSRHYRYDASGYLLSATDPLGQCIAYQTDELGRITAKQLPDGSEEQFDYDPAGNLRAMRNTDSHITRAFDIEGRLLRETQGDDFTLEFGYDANGNRIRRQSSLGHCVDYAYDLSDNVAQIRINGEVVSDIRRNAAGQIDSEQLGQTLSRQFHYNSDGLLTGQALLQAESPIFATQYRYDAAGNLTERHDSEFGRDQYRYDPLGRILEHSDPQGKLQHFLHDPCGDRLQTRLAPRSTEQDAWTRQGQLDDAQYRFDAAGNLIEKQDNDGTLLLRWDAHQRLIESERNGTLTRYAYDAAGRRVYKETNGKRRQFFWDGNALVAESEDKTLSREFIYYPDSFVPLAQITQHQQQPAEVLHYHTDPNGCPIRLSDQRGKIRWSARYEVWGEVKSLHSDNADNPLRFQGQYFDAETGLHYNRHRYFDTESGQFISQDPLGLIVGTSVYQYADNSFKWADPLGLMKCGLTGKEVGNATNLPIVKPGTPEWKNAIESIKTGGKTNFRVKNKATAEQLLSSSKGKIDNHPTYTDAPYKKGYEHHPNESHTINAPENDLPHIKWKDWSSGKKSGGAGHIFYE